MNNYELYLAGDVWFLYDRDHQMHVSIDNFDTLPSMLKVLERYPKPLKMLYTHNSSNNHVTHTPSHIVLDRTVIIL